MPFKTRPRLAPAERSLSILAWGSGLPDPCRKPDELIHDDLDEVFIEAGDGPVFEAVQNFAQGGLILTHLDRLFSGRQGSEDVGKGVEQSLIEGRIRGERRGVVNIHSGPS